LLTAAVAENSEVVRDSVAMKLGPIYSESQKKLYENIDYSLFREDVDVEKAIEILSWTMNGYADKAIEQLMSCDDLSDFSKKYLEEWERYSEILKQSFYKYHERLSGVDCYDRSGKNGRRAKIIRQDKGAE